VILKELEKIVKDERESGMRDDYVRNVLKEYLQVYVLSFVYTNSSYNKDLIFTGGTCLRHLYELERLSEDVDFDYVKDLDSKKLADDLNDYFSKKYKYSGAVISLKQKGGQILIKFPVLDKLNLQYAGGSNFLYVKMDVSPLPSKNYNAILSSQSKYGFNYVARHYDLPDLLAGKIHAVLRRTVLRDRDDRESVKGRDYFDLLWFVKKNVKPNFLRLSDMLGEKVSSEEVISMLIEKVESVGKYISDFESDMLPLVKNDKAVEFYVANYQEEFIRNIRNVNWL